VQDCILYGLSLSTHHSVTTHKTAKSLGQNFLIQEQVARKIVASCNLSCTDTVIEIGAGCGALTSLLSEIAGNVIAIEFDKKLTGFLRDQLPPLLR